MRLGNSTSDYDFWVTKLPEAGYTIGQNDQTAHGGLLCVSGKGYRNGSVAVRTDATTP
jgi:hypothetical protein